MLKDFGRNILILFLIITFSGGLRKWVIDNTLINLLLTILGTTSLIILYYFQKKNNQKIVTKGYLLPLSFFLFYLIICAFNPLNHTFYHGVVGIIIHIGFWIVVFNYLDNKSKYNLFKFNNIIILVSTIQIAIASIQYTSPSDSVWNTLKGNSSMALSEDAIRNDKTELDGDTYKNSAFVGEGVRTTGTFSYLGGYYAYMIFHMLFTFSLFIRKSPLYLSLPMLFIGFLGVLLNGSRSLAFVYLLVSLVFFIFQFRNIKILINGGILIFFFMTLNFIYNDFSGIQNFTSNALENLITRVDQSDEEGRTRITGPFESLFNYEAEYPVFGVGLGSTYSGINSIFGASEHVIRHAYEHEVGRTIQDGGYILLILKFILYAVLIKHLSLKKIFSTVLFLILFFGTLITTNPYLSFYLVLGIIFVNESIIDTTIPNKNDR